MGEVKSIFSSKTFWFNALAAVVTVALSAVENLGPDAGPIALGVVAVGNIVLRFITSQPVSILGGE